MEFVTEVSEFVRLKEEPAEPEAEPERRPPGAARAVHIKEEPQNEHQSDSDEIEDCLQHTTSEYEIKEDPSCFENIVSDVIHGLCDGRVKDEVMQPESVPQIPQTASCSDSECVSEAAMLAGLYTDHDVKDELVLGAECPYRPDVTLVVHGRIGHTIRDCSVTLERIPHIDVLAKRQGTTSSDTESDTDKFTFRGEFHTEEKEPLCDICGERHSVKSDLVKHVIDHIHRPPSMEQEGGAQGNAFVGQCQQEQERVLCRKYAIQDRVRLERLRNQEALAANDTQHTHTEVDAEDIHTRVDNGKPTCDLCGDSFARKMDLKNHIMFGVHMPTTRRSQDVSPNKESDTRIHMYECDLCGASFQQKNTLHIHIKTHSTQSKSKDSKCDNIGEKFYCCEICAERFRSKFRLNKHRRVHYNISSYSCHVCEKRFKTPSDFKRHTSLCSDKRPYSCDVCKKRFKTNAFLKRHILFHSNIRPYSCDVCKKRFKTDACLKRHILFHSDIRPYSCDVCKNRFKTVSEVNSHTRIHSDLRPHSCDVCKKRFKLKAVLNRHTLTHRAPSYSCDVCKKRFSTKDYLKLHILIHGDLRSYSCDVCKKRFNTQVYLKRHILLHSDTRPYSCDVCKKRFKVKAVLNRHARTHRATRSHSCDVCKKRFRTEAYLKLHTLLHSDVRPYSCDVCKRGFITMSLLKRHTLVHVEVRPDS
ncbi:zinc finger protein 58-like [Leguminivora glycinivorella]|uniref:zinc finger protein 58-like n=1 Tax=Leguminivora glycinivorella TaxID=1035111 RepID=UPI00200F3EEE|nr:zinc finger protein 58-like [Leguminivora glycinivorella]